MGAHQAFVRAHNAHVVPHKSSEFVPVVRNDDGLVRIGDLGFVPLGDIGEALRLIQCANDLFRRAVAVDQTFQQRITGQAIGPMQTCATDLANGIQVGQIRTPVIVHHHTTAGVVGGRYHRNWILGDIDAQFGALLRNVRKVALNKIRR